MNVALAHQLTVCTSTSTPIFLPPQYVVAVVLMLMGHTGIMLYCYTTMKTSNAVITQAWSEINTEMKAFIQTNVNALLQLNYLYSCFHLSHTGT